MVGKKKKKKKKKNLLLRLIKKPLVAGGVGVRFNWQFQVMQPLQGCIYKLFLVRLIPR